MQHDRPVQQPAGFRCPACGAEFQTREQLDDPGKQDHKKDR